MCGVGANKDQVNGWFYLVAAIGVYSYATFWLLILPFIEKDFHVIHSLFPPAEYVIKSMVVVGILVLTIASTFLGLVMLRTHAAIVEAQKNAANSARSLHSSSSSLLLVPRPQPRPAQEN